MQLFLTRAEYDALLPMTNRLLSAYYAGTRSWSAAGVTLTLTVAEAAEFDRARLEVQARAERWARVEQALAAADRWASLEATLKVLRRDDPK